MRNLNWRTGGMLVIAWCFGILASAACAAEPGGADQAPGFYRQQLGGLRIVALSDGTHPFPVDTVFRDISKDDIRRDLDRAFLEPPVQGSINAFLVDTGTKRILVDSGAGVLYGNC